MLAVDAEARTATVQPGVVHAALQRAAAPHGLRFGPDPSTHTRCTIGGMIGNNACGSRALGYGRTADNVAGLRVLLGDGSSISTRVQGRPVGPVAALTSWSTGTWRTCAPRSGGSAGRSSGYSLEHLLPENGRRLDRFLVGSEGTLGVVLDATVAAGARARRRPALVVLGYPSMAEAADAVPALLGRPRDGLDRLRGAGLPHRRRGPGARAAAYPRCRAARAGCSSRSPATRPGRPPRSPRAWSRPPARSTAGWSTDVAEAAALWRIREDGAGLAARSLRTPAYSGWEDAAVPPERLGAYLRDFDALLREHGLDGVPYGHFGDGCVHVRIDFELRRRGRGGSGRSSPRPRWRCATTAARCPASTATAGRGRSCCR